MRLGARTVIGAACVGLLVGNIGRIPYLEIGGRAGAITVLDLVLLPLWVLLTVTLASRRRRWRLDAVSRAGLVFVVVAAVSLAIAGPKWGLSATQFLGAGAFLLRWVLYAGWFLLIVTDPDADKVGRDAWERLDKVIVALAVFGIFQSAFLPGFAQIVQDTLVTGVVSDRQGRRLVSTLFDPNFAAGLILIALVMRIGRESEGVETSRWVLFFLAVALVLTLSRSAILGLAAGIATMMIARGVTRPMVRLGVVATAVLLPLLPAVLWYAAQFNKLSVDGSALWRLIPWLRGAVMVRDNPVFGVGFNAAGYAQEAYGWESVGGSGVSMDGGLLFVAVMTGLLGLAAYIWMIGAFGAAARRSWRAPELDAERRAFALGGWAATVAIVVQSFFTNVLLIPWLLLPLWVIWGRVVAFAPAIRRAAPALSVAALLFLGACEPCAGLANCSTPAQRVLTGTILSRDTQDEVAGVRVAAEGVETRTSAAGRWRIVLPSVADSVVDVEVGPEGALAYTVPNVRTRLTTVNGDALDVGVWYDRAFFGYVFVVIFSDDLLKNAQVRFTASAADGGFVLNGNTAGGGYVRLEGDAPRAGPITGTLRVTHPSTGTRNFPGFTVVADWALQVEQIRDFFILDREYRYGGGAIHRGTGENSAAGITFTRTGGLGMAPNPISVTADAAGFFIFSIVPHGRGAITGTMRVTPPGGGVPYTYNNVTLTTYDSTHVRHIGVWAHGERWDWVVEVRRAADSSLVLWTPFEFVRDSGLAIEPSNLVTGITNGSGKLLIRASVRDTGVVRGALTLLPTAEPPRAAGILRLRTFAADTQRFVGVRYIAP
jgi:O-antigen ligase